MESNATRASRKDFLAVHIFTIDSNCCSVGTIPNFPASRMYWGRSLGEPARIAALYTSEKISWSVSSDCSESF